MMKGIIALDIDGTVTAEAHSLPEEVVNTLEELQGQGWIFIFITGRTFQWAYSSLKQLKMPFHLAVQNGAVLLQMPQRLILHRCYLDSIIVEGMHQICHRLNTDFIIYSGYENQDACYYRSHYFSKEHLEYLKKRYTTLKENWIAVEDFKLELTHVASLKCIEKQSLIREVIQEVEAQLDVHIPLNRDPFSPDYYVAQATHPEATKGHILNIFKTYLKSSGPVIAAGDDFNDVSMLKNADIKIVMGQAPEPLLKMADVVAPPARAMGIIAGLRHAIQLSKGG
ncbi:hypothetical protein PHSC3_001166 [Chlamydiales bacterium STE3]|nr:hypothetical protein PHSC3_001166 [Chlamydiales bacterium STE3]